MGPSRSGVELNGFMSDLIKHNLEDKKYTLFGYKAKKVRDNIHDWEVANFFV